MYLYMHKLNQKGSLLLPLILVVLLCVFSLSFGVWAFAGRQDYKDNVDAKITEALQASSEKISLEKAAEFAEKEKSPYKTYQGPSAYGSLKIVYPKTWSAYIIESPTGQNVVEGYMHPNFVPNIQSTASFALRFEVVNSQYDVVAKQLESSNKAGTISFNAYRAPKAQDATGAIITGKIKGEKTGTLVILPNRDKTIRIWTEGQDFKGDFDNILNEITFNQ